MEVDGDFRGEGVVGGVGFLVGCGGGEDGGAAGEEDGEDEDERVVFHWNEWCCDGGSLCAEAGKGKWGGAFFTTETQRTQRRGMELLEGRNSGFGWRYRWLVEPFLLGITISKIQPTHCANCVA